MFEKAARLKLRFPFKGQVSVEDLWDLSLNSLDTIYKALRKEQKDTDEESLLGAETQSNKVLALKVDIVKHVVGVMRAEADARKTNADRLVQKRKIAELISEKEDESLRNLPVDELKSMLNNL